jgi:glycosyltransferase involved in cell wall biosynthesis
MSIKVLDLELTRPIKPVWGMAGFKALRLLARYKGYPLRWVEVANKGQPAISAELIRQALIEQLDRSVVSAVFDEQLQRQFNYQAGKPPVSIIVATHNQPHRLAACLKALDVLDYPEFEIIVVDSNPSGQTSALPDLKHLSHYLFQPHPGLDVGRNMGIAAANYDLIAFIGDNTRPDSDWLSAIAGAFLEPEVKAVTGFVAPAVLETGSQVIYETAFNSLRQRFKRRFINRNRLSDRGFLETPGVRKWHLNRRLIWRSQFTPAELLQADLMGNGMNMAFRREVFDSVGLFNEALSLDTPYGGSGDIDMLHRVVAQGHTLLYEPAALVWYVPPQDEAALRKAAFDRGRAFGAYLSACAQNGMVDRRQVRRFARRAWLTRSLLRRLIRPGNVPRRLIASELAGALLSPWFYFKARRRIASLSQKPARIPQLPQEESQNHIIENANPG